MDSKRIVEESAWNVVMESMRPTGQPPVGSADGELALLFEAPEDARALYAFVTGTTTGIPLLGPGEVVLRVMEEWGQYSVSFSPMTLLLKPEAVAAAVAFYQDHMDEASVTEALTATEEALQQLHEANPFHDRQGNFTSPSTLLRSKQGSFSFGKKKQKKVNPKAKKNLTFKVTKHPCGRDARAVGKTTRCYDGKPGAWANEALVRMIGQYCTPLLQEVQVTAHDRVMLQRIAQLFQARTSNDSSQ